MSKINVTNSSMPSYEEYCEEIKELWESRWLTNMGVKHKELQAGLEEYLKTPHVTLYTNGHLALEYALAALDLPQGGEVITTPFTFASTTHAIVRCGLKPVFCDINPVDFTMDASKIEALITDKTCAIVPVHVYGNLCDVEAIQAVADKYNLKVVYDAAHAFGVEYKGNGVATFGDVSMFSFHATKVFHTIEGGALTYADDSLVTKLNIMKNFGIAGQESVVYAGGNAKMNEYCAAMGVCNLRHIDEEIAKREAVTLRYRQHLEGVEGIQINPVQKDVKPNYAYFPIVIDKEKFGLDRDEVFEKLAENEIGARKYFYPNTNTFECFEGQFDPECTPIAYHMSKNVLTLPLYADLTLEDVDRICEIILKK